MPVPIAALVGGAAEGAQKKRQAASPEHVVAEVVYRDGTISDVIRQVRG
jgi:citrate lyase alpha subunit